MDQSSDFKSSYKVQKDLNPIFNKSVSEQPSATSSAGTFARAGVSAFAAIAGTVEYGLGWLSVKTIAQNTLNKDHSDEHNKVYFPKAIYPCGVCEKKFPEHAAAMEHIKIAHAKRSPMKCGLCSYETFIERNFEKHASMHLRYVEKLHSASYSKCDQCPESFRKPSVLKMHKDQAHARW